MDDIAAIFAKTPPYTDDELAAVITRFREDRAKFNLTGLGASKVSKPKGSKRKTKTGETVELPISDAPASPEPNLDELLSSKG